MITLNQILAEYPGNLRPFAESILKEYLQYKILNSIFNSSYAPKLVFLGGTALRIIYGNSRFSEDLDFDNFDLKEQEFMDLGAIIKKDLMREGLTAEVKVITGNVFRIKIRIPELLFDEGLATMKTQKILIQVDTTPQNFKYVPNKTVLSKFDVFTQINAVPKNLLLSQKICAAVGRKRIMGRDFFDIVFLHGIGASPDFAYLKKNIGIDNQNCLKKYLLEKTAPLDFESLAKDISPLLFDPRDKKSVLLFREFVEQNF